MDRIEALRQQGVTLALLRDYLLNAFTNCDRDDQIAKPNVRKGGDHEVSKIAPRLRNRRDVWRGNGLAPSLVDELFQLGRCLVLALPGSTCRNLQGDGVELSVIAGRVAANERFDVISRCSHGTASRSHPR